MRCRAGGDRGGPPRVPRPARRPAAEPGRTPCGARPARSSRTSGAPTHHARTSGEPDRGRGRQGHRPPPRLQPLAGVPTSYPCCGSRYTSGSAHSGSEPRIETTPHPRQHAERGVQSGRSLFILPRPGHPDHPRRTLSPRGRRCVQSSWTAPAATSRAGLVGDPSPPAGMSGRMSIRQPVSLAARRTFWPSLPMASDSW